MSTATVNAVSSGVPRSLVRSAPDKYPSRPSVRSRERVPRLLLSRGLAPCHKSNTLDEKPSATAVDTDRPGYSVAAGLAT